MRRCGWWQLCALLLTLSVALTALLYAYYGHTFNDLPPPVRLFADSLRWGLPAVVLARRRRVHERAIRTQAAAHAEEQSRVQLGRDETEQQLALLQAQIEPHFLFNVLGSIRRLYRTQPQAGAHTVASLLRYLREALPQLRSQQANLGHELELVRAYLDLFQVRMGARLGFTIEADRALHDMAFPPMLLVTLVENAIKHGIEPSGAGGHVTVRARRNGETVEVAVLDDGVGFGGAPTDGTGVGLVNVRRQLKARVRQRRAAHARVARAARRQRDPGHSAARRGRRCRAGRRRPAGRSARVTMAVAMRPVPFGLPGGRRGCRFRALGPHPSQRGRGGLPARLAYPVTSLASALGVATELSATLVGCRRLQDRGPGLS